MKNNTGHKTFPCGAQSWIDTHYEISAAISNVINYGNVENTVLADIIKNDGSSGVRSYAEAITDKFETEHKDTDWEVSDWYDAIDLFLEQNL